MVESHQSHEMPLGLRLSKLLTPAALVEAINKASVNVRLLDCAFVPKARPPSYKFGHFEADPSDESRQAFLSAHVSGAVHFNLALATHATDYEKFAHYPAEIFEQYAQLLGLNSDDHLVFYGRGPFGGMLFASRAYWLFKSYGHAGGLSVLDGGLAAWEAHQMPVVSTVNAHEAVFVAKKGNWRAKTEPSAKTVSFEQLTAAADDGTCTRSVDNCAKWLLLDARPRPQFEGLQNAFDPSKQMPTGSHLPGAVNVPSTELIDAESGQFVSAEQLQDLVVKNGIKLLDEKDDKILVSLCNSGIQASMLATVLDAHFGPQIGHKLRVYTGSMLEVQARAPELINEK
ncbi:hypothetical protein niasHS_001412 [Heterodera schachtii]|uniref:Rhodanese domain-containing protein n=1 Tax=Heterodera schachtii TaxID=97005 RepID=A0ABD2KDE9_HETSC